ncbi:MAG TPA: Txe/YoeB family addiction module toxin [Micromonosporaceae bacterium]|nr:Txe/YoeB family addiction module toxin [Micromonosporaceae bacterium]
MKISFSDEGWADYVYWQGQDRRTLKRINLLINDIKRNGNEGLGKPEALVGILAGWWSRRIDEKNRLVSRIAGDLVEVSQCRYHYDDS